MEIKEMNEQEFATELSEQVLGGASVSDVMHLLDQWRKKQEDILNNERLRIWNELDSLTNETAFSSTIEVESDDLHDLLFHDSKITTKQVPQMEAFEKAARPLMSYIGATHHPHTTAIVTSNRAELVEGLTCFNTDEYVKD